MSWEFPPVTLGHNRIIIYFGPFFPKALAKERPRSRIHFFGIAM
jgi:hypothetical protein